MSGRDENIPNIGFSAEELQYLLTVPLGRAQRGAARCSMSGR